MNAGRGTLAQALVGWAGAVAAGLAFWWFALPAAWRALSDWAEVMWP